ncbi:MAG: MlaD family protein [Thermoleophilaceae bacterium]
MSFRRGGVSATGAGVVAIVLTVLVVYVVFGGRMPWQHSFQLKAVVQDATELSSRSPVRVAGVDVGKVASVERGPGTTAVVTMNISNGALPIHRDATMKIRPRLFLEGNFFVDLSPGTPSTPSVDSGYELPVAQTATPVQLDQVLTTLQSSSRADLQQVVHTFAQSLDKGGAEALRRMLPEWGPAFIQLSQVQQAIRGQGEHDLSGFIASSEKVAGKLAEQDQSLSRLVSGLNGTLRATGETRAQLAESVSQLDRMVGLTNPALASVNRALPSTRTFFREVRPGVKEAPASLHLANALTTQVQGLLSKPELPALLSQLRPALSSLSSLQPGLQNVFAGLTPVTECLRTHALPVLETPVDDGALSTHEPPYRELLYSGVGLASSAQDFTGDGPAVRYHAGFGDQTVSTGSVPGIGQLVGLTSSPLLGSRPKTTTVPPPFRPDVPCVTQKLPDLHAETGPAPQQRSLK